MQYRPQSTLTRTRCLAQKTQTKINKLNKTFKKHPQTQTQTHTHTKHTLTHTVTHLTHINTCKLTTLPLPLRLCSWRSGEHSPANESVRRHPTWTEREQHRYSRGFQATRSSFKQRGELLTIGGNWSLIKVASAMLFGIYYSLLDS